MIRNCKGLAEKIEQCNLFLKQWLVFYYLFVSSCYIFVYIKETNRSINKLHKVFDT
jgi:hypothetical protein